MSARVSFPELRIFDVMTSAQPAPPTPLYSGEIRARERRSYALNLCRHCGCFAHLTLRAAVKQIGFGRAKVITSTILPAKPHPLGDLAGRIAYAQWMENAPPAARPPPTSHRLIP